jgi:hypothetical protein
MTHWHKFTGGLIGLWLLAAPNTFGFQGGALIWSDCVCGLLLIILGPFFPICIYGGIGIWLGLAPLIFWSPDAACYLNDTLISILLFMFFIPMSGAMRPLPIGPDIPPGWSYNPSTWPQRLPIALLAFICWMISRYLAAYQLGYIDSVWDPFFGSGTVRVLTSDVSKAFPVADAGLGAFAYTLEMFSAFMGNERRWKAMPWMVLIFGVLTVPVSLVSVILIILQPLVVGAWCTLCLVTAFCMLIGIPLAISEVIATLQYLRGNWKALFHGGECLEAKIDHEPVLLNGPILPFLRSMKKGIAAPWNLVLSSLLGAFLMAAPGIFAFDGIIADLDRIFGALIVVSSVVAFAAIARIVRLANVLWTIPLLMASFFSSEKPVLHFALGVLIILLSVFRARRHK